MFELKVIISFTSYRWEWKNPDPAGHVSSLASLSPPKIFSVLKRHFLMNKHRLELFLANFDCFSVFLDCFWTNLGKSRTFYPIYGCSRVLTGCWQVYSHYCWHKYMQVRVHMEPILEILTTHRTPSVKPRMIMVSVDDHVTDTPRGRALFEWAFVCVCIRKVLPECLNWI